MKPDQISPDTIEPDLAESWSSNPAGPEWTFHIRHGVQCHWNTGEFWAEDVASSIKPAAIKATWSYSNDFSSVVSADAVDPYTLKITLKNPVAGVLGYVANINRGNMVCEKAAEEMGDGFSKSRSVPARSCSQNISRSNSCASSPTYLWQAGSIPG
jgi:peptide/nickel transport system substrate-binding protein